MCIFWRKNRDGITPNRWVDIQSSGPFPPPLFCPSTFLNQNVFVQEGESLVEQPILNTEGTTNRSIGLVSSEGPTAQLIESIVSLDVDKLVITSAQLPVLEDVPCFGCKTMTRCTVVSFKKKTDRLQE